MAEKKHISVRLEQQTRADLELIAKRRMMANGEAVTLADLIREGLAKFAAVELATTAPKLAKAKEEQHDLFNAPKARAADDLDDLRAKAKALSASGLSSYKIAEQLGVSQTKVSRRLLK